ncbi:MAG: zinc ABC transporter solute-binding protein, partial [Phycisphaerae bacterium]|nr:zinc ABC transporter solute-binding protein [Phycisphaerae bacterium]NIU09108.1 zinc ABC transporter solute-binding protein [Phycisphaerae bacterium]NIW49171.1 zinc ABC transporter solute-binding protein [Gammaproteobacteria bacterium]NIX02271.1 zinc ABC transporter solute-binding protein [Phycisphaerae bacterium]
SVSSASYAAVNVVTSVPDLAAITKEIGGDKVKVKSLAKGYQNPHYVDAKPSYIVDLNKADLLIYIGLDLEIGWLPVLVTGARNSKINTTNKGGNLNTSTLVPLLNVSTIKVDRSQGDIHPAGNPHFLLDPRNAIRVATGIAGRLGEIDPENKAYYQENLSAFSSALKIK